MKILQPAFKYIKLQVKTSRVILSEWTDRADRGDLFFFISFINIKGSGDGQVKQHRELK